MAVSRALAPARRIRRVGTLPLAARAHRLAGGGVAAPDSGGDPRRHLPRLVQPPPKRRRWRCCWRWSWEVAGYRAITFDAAREAFTESARQTAVVMLLVAGSAVLGWYLANQQAPERLTAWVLARADAPWAVAIVLDLVLLLAGTILAQRRRGGCCSSRSCCRWPSRPASARCNFGMMVTVSLAVGQQTPPVASVLITTCSHRPRPGSRK